MQPIFFRFSLSTFDFRLPTFYFLLDSSNSYQLRNSAAQQLTTCGQIIIEPVEEFYTNSDSQKQAGQKKFRRSTAGGFSEKGDKNQGKANGERDAGQYVLHCCQQRINRAAGKVPQGAKKINKGENNQAQIIFYRPGFRFFPVIGNFVHDF